VNTKCWYSHCTFQPITSSFQLSLRTKLHPAQWRFPQGAGTKRLVPHPRQRNWALPSSPVRQRTNRARTRRTLCCISLGYSFVTDSPACQYRVRMSRTVGGGRCRR